MEERYLTAVVIDKSSDFMKLRIVESDTHGLECHKCAFRTFCNVNKGNEDVWTLPTRPDLQVGDKVMLFIPEWQIILIAFLVFTCPLIAPIVVLALTQNALWTTVALVVSLLILKKLDKYLADRIIRPQVVKIS